VVVPAEAVIRSGDYDQVFVVNPAGDFEPRRVRLGVESQGSVAIASGVEAGERVVVSAQFLVDSESSLRAAAARMTEPAGGAGMDHGGMDHSQMNHGGMDHSQMDHSEMDHGGVDHSQMDHSEMDHGGVDHSQMDHGGMDHSQMEHDGADHGAMNHD
jgi:Cu(I)/Ag(I) efflux system membrane fusion protein